MHFSTILAALSTTLLFTSTMSSFINDSIGMQSGRSTVSRNDTLPTVTTSTKSLNGASGEDRECPADTYCCGSLCCPSPGTCSVDATASFHCCSDKTFCAANTTSTPTSTGSTRSPPVQFYWIVLVFTIVLAADDVHDAFGEYTSVSLASQAASRTLNTGTADDSARLRTLPNEKATASQSARREEYVSVYWEDLQMCGVKGTLPHSYSTGEQGCCDSALISQTDDQIEAQCPVAVGQANLKFLEDGVARSQAIRSSTNWVENLSAKLLRFMTRQATNDEDASGSSSPVQVNGEDALQASEFGTGVAHHEAGNVDLKRQIIGPGCGGFDPDCEQTCPAGWATCQTSAAATSRGSNFLARMVRFLNRSFAFVR